MKTGPVDAAAAGVERLGVADHEIFFISDTVDQMDLSEILREYDEPRGNPPYHPRMMVKVSCTLDARRRTPVT